PGLGLCALIIGATSALATVGSAAVLPDATDPSAAGGALTWQQPGGPAMLRLPGGATRALPGTYPALGPASIAWQAEGRIAVADLASIVARQTIPAVGLNAFAVSAQWLAYRQEGGGGEQLIAVALA